METKRVIPFIESNPGLWGLRKIFNPITDENTLDVIETTSTGSGVNIYFVDSGVNFNHFDFKDNPFNNSSIQTIYDPFGTNGLDTFGHGSHICSLISGKSQGVAPGASIFNLKVFDYVLCSSPEIILGALATIKEHYLAQKTKKPTIAHLGFFIGYDEKIEAAIRELVQLGISVVCPAGQSNENSDELLPAGMQEVICVGSFDVNNKISASDEESLLNKHNYGSHIDIYAPGVKISGASQNDNFDTVELSGTSVAAAFVSGVLACHLEVNPEITPQEAKSFIINNSKEDILKPANDTVSSIASPKILHNTYQVYAPNWNTADPFLGCFIWGEEINIQLKAESSSGNPIQYSIEGGNLPNNLSLSKEGLLSGKIVKAPLLDESNPLLNATEYFTFLFVAKDDSGQAEQMFYLASTSEEFINEVKQEQIMLAQGAASTSVSTTNVGSSTS